MLNVIYAKLKLKYMKLMWFGISSLWFLIISDKSIAKYLNLFDVPLNFLLIIQIKLSDL